ncbi:MAG TPA: hypothetical protein VL947_04345, partial [Cytophagales bacterium]|nr:hypothetical protein [Cytophagales bacterium]
KGRPGAFTKFLTINSDAIESSKQIKFTGEVLPAAPAEQDNKTVNAPQQDQKGTEQKVPATTQKKSVQKKTTKKVTKTSTTKKKTADTPKK